MQNKLNLNKLKSEFDKFPNLPKGLFDYIAKVVALNKQNDKFLTALIRHGTESVLTALDILIERASNVLNVHSSEIIRISDFDSNDVGTGRIDAFIAELRVINWLNDIKFKNISFLIAKRIKMADIYAEYDSDKYIIEVFCAISGSYRWPGHKNKSKDLISYYISRANEKKNQLDHTALKFNCNKKIIVLVLDSDIAVALNTRSDFLEILKRIYDILGWGDKYYFAIMTGRTSFNGSDDVIYPEL